MAHELAPKLFGNRLMVLAGDRGRGKTQIVTFIAYHRMTKGHDSGIYTRLFDMARMCDGYSSEAKKALSAFQRVPFLCVDEAHRLEPGQIQTVESILDARYANKRPTVIIGNWLTIEGVKDGEEVSGQKLRGLGPTLMDRVNEHKANQTGGVVWCRWESYRTTRATP
jgi:DNA replication protein DnaC